MEQECAQDARLRDLTKDLRERDDLERLSERELLALIGDRAQYHYSRLWEACSQREKLVLVHLAQGDLVNPRAWRTVRGLYDRCLLEKDPSVRPKNATFARFVLEQEARSPHSEWDHGESTWTRWRKPFVVATALIAGFFLYTQGDQAHAVASFAGSAAALIPAIVATLGMLQGRSSST